MLIAGIFKVRTAPSLAMALTLTTHRKRHPLKAVEVFKFIRISLSIESGLGYEPTKRFRIAAVSRSNSPLAR